MIRRTHAALAIATIAIASSLALAQSPAARRPTIDDFVSLVQASNPRISPDGRHVLYTRSEIERWEDNKRVQTIWIAAADGSGARPFLGSDKDRSPQWSPDGRHVAFLSTRGQAPAAAGAGAAAGGDKGPQIWLIRTDGGEAWKLTAHKGTIRGFEWAADSGAIFFVSSEAKSDAEKAAEKAGDDVVAVDEGPNGQTRGRWHSLWTIPIGEGAERRITTEPLLINGFKPAPDGASLVITYRREAERNGQYRAEVAIVDAATGARRDLTKNEAPESDARFSPDGRTVSFTAPSDTAWDLATDKLFLVPAGGGRPEPVATAFTGSIGDYYWAKDGRSILFGGMKNGRGGAFRLTLAGGEVETIATGDWVGAMDSLSADQRLAAGVISSPSRPGDLGVLDLTTGASTLITDLNPKVRELELADFRAVTWKSADGLEVEGLLWLPKGYTAGRLPLLLSVHGGPAGVWTTSFRALNHVYAALGWAVLEPNVRGSSTYGDPLLRGNMKDIGGGDYQDLMTGVDALIAQGIADPGQLAIRGWSYGGILGGWTITQTDRFKAASLGAMVSDWTSEYAMGFNHDIRLWYIGGTPWENPEAYRRQSPYTHVGNVKTPTIIIHGEDDTTDTIGQSMMFYQGLKDRGVPVRFLRFPREPHGFTEPAHQRTRDVEEIAWLMKHARGIEWKAPVKN